MYYTVLVVRDVNLYDSITSVTMLDRVSDLRSLPKFSTCRQCNSMTNWGCRAESEALPKWGKDLVENSCFR